MRQFRNISLVASLALMCQAFSEEAPNIEPVKPELDSIEIIGKINKDVYPASSSTTFKGEVSTLSSSRRVDTVTRDLMDDLDATVATELWRVIPSTFESERGAVVVRGFTLDQRPAAGAQLFDGVASSVYNLVPVNFYNIERIEVLKGPAGVMYGQGQPGGLINYVLKKPKDIQANEFSVHTDSNGKQQFTLDSTGPIADTSKGKFLYRVNATGEESETFRRDETFSQFRVSPAVSWIPNENTTVTLLGEWFEDHRTGGRGYGTPVRQGDPFAMPRDYSINDPDDFRKTEGGFLQLEADHKFSEQLKLHAITFASRTKYHNKYHEGRRSAADDASDTSTYNRQYRDQKSDTKTFGIDAHITWEKESQDISHRLLVGADYLYIKDPQFPAIDAYITNPYDAATNPDGAAPIDLDDLYELPPGPAGYGIDSSQVGHGRYTQYGIYTSYRIDWQKEFFGNLGFRYGDFDAEATSFNRLTDTLDWDRSNDDQNYSVDLGLVWQFNEQMSTYYGYSTGERSQSVYSLGNNKAPFDPLEFVQHEVAFNGETLDQQLGGSVTLYQITRSNELGPDTSPSAMPGDQIEIGETRSQGLELTLRGNISDDTSISLTYAYTDAFINKSNTTSSHSGDSLKGEALQTVPENSGNITIGHNVSNSPIRLIASWTYVDDRKARLDSADPLQFNMPSYSLLDLGFAYKKDNWKVRFGVNNAFDKDYVIFYRPTGHQVNRGEPRTYTVSYTASF